MRILVVEDEKKVAKALRDGLERKPSALQSLRECLPSGGGALLCDDDRRARRDHESRDHDHCNETLHDIDLLRASSGLLTVMSQMATVREGAGATTPAPAHD
jgi:hypothetical protein